MEVKLALEILVKMLHQIIIIETKPLIAKTANIILFLTGNNVCVVFFTIIWWFFFFISLLDILDNF